MNQTITNPLSTSKSQSKHAANPFARALAETEQNALSQGKSGAKPDLSGLSGLDNLGNDFGQFGATNPFGTTYDAEKMRQEQADKARKERMRRQLHEQINPVDSTKLFDARHKQVKEEIDKLRVELKALAQDVSKFHKEVELTLMTEVGDPGQEGKYYINFFQQLRAFIMLLRQKIKSARTWASQMNSKKKKRKIAAGIVLEGKSHEKTTGVYDMMHHERSNAFGG